MKAIMISIKPEWVGKILVGKKTIEIRKTMPKCKLPIDVYIYCTKSFGKYGYKKRLEMIKTDLSNRTTVSTILNGKVIAKFTLNKVEEIKYHFGYYDMGEWTESYILENACLSSKELDDYLKASKEYDEKKPSKVYGYAWHIDNLEIFDRPRELGEFRVSKKVHKCDTCIFNPLCVGICTKETYSTINTSLTKSPQSWCYVEVKE